MDFLLSNLSTIFSILTVFSAVFLGIFLFFRAGRHELLDDEVIFDSIIFALIGGAFGGRILDFVIRYDFYNWSFKKLFFFNAYSGIDWYGVLIGAAFASAFYLKQKKINYWYLFDLAAAPIAFALTLINLSRFLIYRKLEALTYFAGFLVIFWTLKRFAKLKRHNGFFASLSLISASILNLAVFSFKKGEIKILGTVYYSFIMPAIFLLVGLFLFYTLTKRTIKSDIKSIGALFLLLILKLKRSLTSINEANFSAKAIVFLPLTIAKIVFDLVKWLGREIYLSLVEISNVFGVKR